MRYALITLLAASACFAGSNVAKAQQTIDRGWWVVTGSFYNPDGSNWNERPVAATERQVSRCGVVPFADFSDKFAGFEPGYDVVVVGPYPDIRSAEDYLERVRYCVPSAYLKPAQYLGE